MQLGTLGRSAGSLLKSIGTSNPVKSGAVAQLGERLVRNEEATGSIPVSSTIVPITCRPFLKMLFTMWPFYWNTNGTRFDSCSTYSLCLDAARF
jgi:hypothetical protein